jgi:hypothetical protein
LYPACGLGAASDTGLTVVGSAAHFRHGAESRHDTDVVSPQSTMTGFAAMARSARLLPLDLVF